MPKAKAKTTTPRWKPGDRVKVRKREATDADREGCTYFEHLAGLTGTVRNVFSQDEVAVSIDFSSMQDGMLKAHTEAVKRMRAKFLAGLSEEQRRSLSPEEKHFFANYVILVKGSDLEPGPAKAKAEDIALEDEEVENYEGENIAQGVLYDDVEIPEGARLSPDDLDKAEEEELKKRSRKRKRS
ncbi:MAG: hypothetical protein C4341_09475 [Armatimonadota bacterium]